MSPLNVLTCMLLRQIRNRSHDGFFFYKIKFLTFSLKKVNKIVHPTFFRCLCEGSRSFSHFFFVCFVDDASGDEVIRRRPLWFRDGLETATISFLEVGCLSLERKRLFFRESRRKRNVRLHSGGFHGRDVDGRRKFVFCWWLCGCWLQC